MLLVTVIVNMLDVSMHKEIQTLVFLICLIRMYVCSSDFHSAL